MGGVFCRSSILLLSSLLLLTACGGGDEKVAPDFGAESLSFVLTEDSQLNAVVTAANGSGQSMQYRLVSAARQGSFRLLGAGAFSYQPQPNYFGPDQVTILADNGTASTELTLLFSISPVNDSPVWQTERLNVAGAGQSQGQLVATDVDGDRLRFTLLTPPSQGTLLLEPETGAVAYTPTELEFAPQQFEVAVTDGQSEPVRQWIHLQPSYLTNSDKLNYYYSHANSHLNKAAAVQQLIADDTQSSAVSAPLAAGYYQAGFRERALELLDTAFPELSTQANAYLAVASQALVRQEYLQANQLLAKASNLYSQALQERGLANITVADARFFITVMNLYARSGSSHEANSVATLLASLAEQIRQPLYSTTYNTFLTAYQTNLEELSELWLAEPSLANRQTLLLSLQQFELLAEKTGYQLVPSGSNRGEKYEQQKAFRLSQVADYYHRLGETAAAKRALARLMALYTEANYDPQFTEIKSAYADITRLTYVVPLAAAAGLLAYYYPDMATNRAQSLIASSNSAYRTASNNIHQFRLQRAVEQGQTLTTVLAPVAVTYSAQRDLFYMLFDGGTSTLPGLATQLRYRGQHSAAVAALEAAADVMLSPAYQSQNQTPAAQLGANGCYSLLRFLQQLAATSQQAAIAQRCLTAGQQNFANAATANQILAYRYLLSISHLVAEHSVRAALKAKLQQLVLSLNEPLQQAQSGLEIAALLASQQDFASAAEFFAAGMAAFDATLAAQASAGDQFASLLTLLHSTVGENYDSAPYVEATFGRMNYLRAMRFAASTGQAQSANADLPAIQQRAMAMLAFYQRQALASQNALRSVMQKSLLAANLPQQAMLLATSAQTAPADRLSLLAEVGRWYAMTDHFPGSLIALVDTDLDGRPNFFTSNASASDIAASGLVADTDADGDGIADLEDARPLDAE